MAPPHSRTETMTLADAAQPLDLVVERVMQSRLRILVERDGVPVAAVISAEDLAQLQGFGAELDGDLAVFAEIGAAFRDVDPEEIERETAMALAEVRAEMRAEREKVMAG